MLDHTAERDYLEAAIAGSQPAIEQLLLAYYSLLEEYIEKSISGRANRHFSAEDILQVVFSQVFKDIARFEPCRDGAFFGWLKAIADHRIIDAFRKLDRGGGKQISIAQYGDSGTIADLFEMLCEKSPSPSRLVRNNEALSAMRIAIAELPTEQQEAIRLLRLEQKSLSDVAAELGRSEPAVRGLVYRAMQNLTQAMGRASRWLSSR